MDFICGNPILFSADDIGYQMTFYPQLIFFNIQRAFIFYEKVIVSNEFVEFGMIFKIFKRVDHKNAFSCWKPEFSWTRHRFKSYDELRKICELRKILLFYPSGLNTDSITHTIKTVTK